MSESDEFYFRIQDESINTTLSIIPFMNEVFRNPLYDLKMTVENDVDFLLGGVFGQMGMLLVYTSKGKYQDHPLFKKLNLTNDYFQKHLNLKPKLGRF